jgi:hypothetical protein
VSALVMAVVGDQVVEVEDGEVTDEGELSDIR